MTQYSNLHKRLFVMPYSAMAGWINTLEQEDIKFSILTADFDVEYIKMLVENDTISWYLTNQESFLRIGGIIKNTKWLSVTIDESTCIMNPKARISKFYAGHSRNFKDVPYRTIMTGTPNPNSEMDYITQYRFLDNAFGNYFQFQDKYCTRLRNYNIVPSMEGVRKIRDHVSKTALIMKIEDIRQVIPPVRIQRMVKLSEDHMSDYKSFLKNSMLTLNGTTLKIKSVPGLFSHLRKFTSGFFGTLGENGDRPQGLQIHQQKINELLYLVTTELKGQRIVVWSDFRRYEMPILCREFKKRRITHKVIHGDIKPLDRIEIIRDFNSGNCNIVICHPRTAEMGVDFSTADHQIWLSSTLSPKVRQQCERRLDHQDRTTPYSIIDILIENTIDQDIYTNLMEAKSRADMSRRMVRSLSIYRSKMV
jgi:SNF2 family DNA or RNA helicase